MKRTIVLILGALVLLGGLTGCSRDERALKSEQHAKKLIENYAKNQDILQEGERRMYRAEAEAHVDTHFKWDVERVANGPMERTAAIAEVSRLSDVRVQKLKVVEAKVQGMKDAYELTLKDLVGARGLYAKLEEYNKASSFNFFGLFGAGSRVEPPAEIVPVDLNPPQPPKIGVPPVLE